MLPQYWSRGGYCLTDVEECKLLALATIVAPSVGLTQLKLKIQREREGVGGGEREREREGRTVIRQSS